MNIAREIESMGADSICIKDMAGLLVPYKAEKLVKALKAGSSLPLEMHTHYTSGVASMTYLKAVEAGADIIDCAILRPGYFPARYRSYGRDLQGNPF